MKIIKIKNYRNNKKLETKRLNQVYGNVLDNNIEKLYNTEKEQNSIQKLILGGK